MSSGECQDPGHTFVVMVRGLKAGLGCMGLRILERGAGIEHSVCGHCSCYSSLGPGRALWWHLVSSL